jgi:hypothetical protein
MNQAESALGVGAAEAKVGQVTQRPAVLEIAGLILDQLYQGVSALSRCAGGAERDHVLGVPQVGERR